ncbi:MAG: hemerythrin domain-containing protein [Myxococcota bacterium]
MADIIALLKEDHQKVKDLFERIERSTERGTKTRTDLLARLAADLRVHMRFEEESFYPVVKAGADKAGRELTCEAYAEHDAASAVLAKLEAIAPSDEMWKANASVLKESVEHHIKEEERELFKHAKSVLTKDELRRLGEQYAAMKREPDASAAPTTKARSEDADRRGDDGDRRGDAPEEDDLDRQRGRPAADL